MTISDELETLIQTKKNIKAAITNKGVSIPSGTPFASYPDAINAIIGEGGSIDLSDYATKDYVDDAIANIEISGGNVDLTGYATESYVNSVTGNARNEAMNYALGLSNNKADKNHSHDEYLTEHQSLEGYATEKYVNDAIGNINSILDNLNGEEV